MQSESIIKSLIDEIVSIDAASLELFGRGVIELIEGRRLVHHGLNADHRPVGYTVDTFSQSGDVIGEYSAEKGYFVNAAGEDETPFFKKVAKNIDHALSYGNPKKIYLIASQEEPESFRAKFLKSDHARSTQTSLKFSMRANWRSASTSSPWEILGTERSLVRAALTVHRHGR